MQANRVRSAAVRWRRTAIRTGCAAAALALAGCATPGYSPTRIQSELVRAGTHKGDVDEFATTRAILKKCGVNLPLQQR